jgi:hypothetical protein
LDSYVTLKEAQPCLAQGLSRSGRGQGHEYPEAENQSSDGNPFFHFQAPPFLSTQFFLVSF